MRRELELDLRYLGPVAIDFALACEVMINVFGLHWYGSRLAADTADPYFTPSEGAPMPDYIRQARVIGLAEDLLVCQYLNGFAEQREQMSTRDVIGLYHELRVARLLQNSGHEVEFVVPSGKKGADFDLLVDGKLAVDAKAKQDEATYKKSSLRNALLSDARRQLPADGPGLLALRVPDTWVLGGDFIHEADDLFADVLRQTGRVNALLLLWDEWLPGEAGGALCITRFRVWENASPRTDFPDLPRILRSAALDGSMQNADLAIEPTGWTLACIVRRHGGAGPLLETWDGHLQMVFDRAGRVANRIAGEIHVSNIPITDINGRWAVLVLRLVGSTCELYIDDALVDTWDGKRARYAGLRVAPAVDVDLREQLVHAGDMNPEELAKLLEYLGGRCGTGPYVQFRRGDLARFRTGT
jgi:hypothetical protein